jgi:ectoine hydroxylase-related dioxygenase (phytanoyl-CoA dioxygenase family)
MKSYGILNLKNVESSQDLHLEEFYNLGYTVIENIIPESEILELTLELDKIYQIQIEEIGIENLKKINEENLVRAPLAYSDLFIKLASRRDLTHYIDKILGKFYILHLQNGVINMPSKEHHQSSWHRDLPYQNWTSSEPLACNIFYCLDDFNHETGGTFFLPFSHRFEYAPSIEYMENHSIQINAKAGSAVLFNSMVFHKAGYNNSEKKIRRGINNQYTKPIISQQINLPAFLQGKYSEDDYLSMLLGYDSVITESVKEYRQIRVDKRH